MAQMSPSDPNKAKAARASRQAPFGLLTSGCLVHYTGPGQVPYVAQIGFDRRVSTPQRVYVCDLLISSQWVAVDTGWVKTPGILLVVNNALKGSHHIIQVGIQSDNGTTLPFALVLPGEACPLHPMPGAKLVLRHNKLHTPDAPDTPVTIHAFPG